MTPDLLGLQFLGSKNCKFFFFGWMYPSKHNCLEIPRIPTFLESEFLTSLQQQRNKQKTYKSYRCGTYNQWLFLVPLKGGRWHSPSPNWQYIPLIYHLYIAFWGVICYLPPFRGTRNNHWYKSYKLEELSTKSPNNKLLTSSHFWKSYKTPFTIIMLESPNDTHTSTIITTPHPLNHSPPFGNTNNKSQPQPYLVTNMGSWS